MKLITIIVHQAAKSHVLDNIAGVEGVKGCFVQSVNGYFEGVGVNPFETEMDLVEGYTPRIRIDVLIGRNSKNETMQGVMECASCAKGRGVWYIRDIEEWGLL